MIYCGDYNYKYKKAISVDTLVIEWHEKKVPEKSDLWYHDDLVPTEHLCDNSTLTFRPWKKIFILSIFGLVYFASDPWSGNVHFIKLMFSVGLIVMYDITSTLGDLVYDSLSYQSWVLMCPTRLSCTPEDECKWCFTAIWFILLKQIDK
jgi:hypothetical protein